MSDHDDFTESEEESGDFSVSEDEWIPEEETSDESSDDDEDDIADTVDSGEEGASNRSKAENNKKTKRRIVKNISKNPKLGQNSRSQSSSLRSRLNRHFNPRPKSTGSPVPVKVANILSNLQYVKRKQMAPSQSNHSDAKQTAESNQKKFDSESESSGDEGLVRPSDIDFNADMFKAPSKTAAATSTEAPSFDCNAGMKLSDSSDTDGNDENEENDFVEASTSNMVQIKSRNVLIDKINQKSSGEVHDFSNLQEFAKNLESAKAHLQKMKDKEANTAKSGGATNESDVAKLLSMGEQKSVATAAKGAGSRKRKHKDEQPLDDSDWENVSDDNEDNTTNDIKDIQITVGGSTIRDMSRDKKKIIDLEACLKRRLNREIKENQIFSHKVSTLGWIGHGNYINRILNDMTLMEMCLKLLPSKNAYPDGDTDIQYFKAITAWFNELFKLKSKNLYCNLKGLQSKLLSLQLQLRTKQVICKCDYILLFVSMLRSIGIQCRLVINLVVLPLRPPQKDLFVVSTKPKEEIEESNKNKNSSSTVTLAKKLKISTSKMKTSFVEKEAEKPKKRSESNISPEKPSASGKSGAVQSKLRLVKQDKMRNTGSPVPMSQFRNGMIDSNKKPEPMAQGRKRHEESVDTNGPSISGRSKSSTSSKSKSSSRSHVKDHSYSSPQSSHSREPSASPSKSHRKQPSTSSSSSYTKQSSTSSFSSRGKQPSTCTSKSSSAKNDKPTTITNISKTNGETSSKIKIEKSSNESSVSSKPTIASRVPKQSGANVPMFSPRKTRRQAAKLNLKLPQLDGAGDISKKGTKRTNAKSQKIVDDSDESSDDSDFQPSPPKRIRSKLPTKKVDNRQKSNTKANTSRKIDRRVFSDEDDPEQDVPNTERMDFWVEAYAEKEKKWIPIDPVKKKIDCIDHVRKSATKPIIYVFAWNNDNTLRDVTPRYCSQFHTSVRKMRAEQLWIDDAIRSFAEQRNSRTIIEDVEFSKLQMDAPMPSSINEYKNHPMYALERHLLKFEAIYPPNALTLGYCRNEPVYARECVRTLHSREIWVKQARTVKIGEKPYKIVKARPKWNRLLNQMEDAKPLEIFGHWQTEPYQPPVAENGIVPRNAYGNVELFKPEMLPIGTRHLQLPNLNRVCRKMNVDCAQAVIGFDFHGGSSHPTFDGFVVCEEFADEVIKQWEIEQEEQVRKEIEKREARVYGNWKKLIKGLLIRERLKRKFNFGLDAKPEKGKKKTQK